MVIILLDYEYIYEYRHLFHNYYKGIEIYYRVVYNLFYKRLRCTGSIDIMIIWKDLLHINKG